MTSSGKSFTIGNVSANRDVNIDSTVTNTSYTIQEVFKDLKDSVTDEESKQRIEQLQKAVENKDTGLFNTIIDSLSGNMPTIVKVCKSLIKLVI